MLLTRPFGSFRLGSGNFESQHRLRNAVLVVRSRELNWRFGLLQLRLAHLDNGTQAKFVALLREVECEVGLVYELLTDADPVEVD